MNLPNCLTLFRILLVPVFVNFLIYDHILFAFATFICAGITDALDGMIARVWNQKTLLGAYLDPIADKLLLVTSYIMLAIVGIIPAWLAVLVISRDIVILTGIAILFINNKSIEISPTIIGKASTFAQISTVIMSLSADIPIIFLHSFVAPSIYLTALLTLISGFHYMLIGVRKMG